MVVFTSLFNRLDHWTQTLYQSKLSELANILKYFIAVMDLFLNAANRYINRVNVNKRFQAASTSLILSLLSYVEIKIKHKLNLSQTQWYYHS